MDAVLFALAVLAVDVLLSLLVAQYAQRRGHQPEVSFLLSLCLSPLIGLLIAVAQGTTEEARMRGKKKCPRCAEEVQQEAMVCRYCGMPFEGEMANPAALASSSANVPVAVPAAMSLGGEIGFVVALLIGLAVIIVLFIGNVSL